MLLVAICFLFGYAAAHSWLHCIDYAPSASLQVGAITMNACRARARGIPANAVFGEDRGYDYRPTDTKACRDRYSGSLTPYRAGQTIRLLWPAKNHAAASCTNPYVPRGSLKLYAYPVVNASQPDPTFTSWTSALHLIHDFDAAGRKGFPNCPDFCPQTDRVPCFGDVTLPTSLRPGVYKMMWAWNFNINEWFTHCFDINVSGTAPSTKAPTRQTATKAPTASSKAPTASACAQLYRQCGGIGWTGPTCCITGSRCVAQNSHYAQCVPN